MNIFQTASMMSSSIILAFCTIPYQCFTRRCCILRPKHHLSICQGRPIPEILYLSNHTSHRFFPSLLPIIFHFSCSCFQFCKTTLTASSSASFLLSQLSWLLDPVVFCPIHARSLYCFGNMHISPRAYVARRSRVLCSVRCSSSPFLRTCSQRP